VCAVRALAGVDCVEASHVADGLALAADAVAHAVADVPLTGSPGAVGTSRVGTLIPTVGLQLGANCQPSR